MTCFFSIHFIVNNMYIYTNLTLAEFEVNLIVVFVDDSLVTENFALNLSRY